MALVLDQGLTRARLQPNIVTFGQFMPATPLSTLGPLTPNVVTFGQNAEEEGTDWGEVAKFSVLNLLGLALTTYVATRVIKKAWTGSW